VESANDPLHDPILFWSNGGPGCSGLFGMGFEHGPFLAQSDGGLLLNPYSWNRNHTVVYYEQPAGVGFSYSSAPQDYDNYNDNVAASDNAAFLTSFFNLYPQYQSLPLFLTSESYGGNYVPQMARAILTGTDERLKAQLKTGGVAVGNPVFSSDDATFEDIMDLVQVDILYGHALLPSRFVDDYKNNKCNTLHPPEVPCDALQREMIDLAGTCYGKTAQLACGRVANFHDAHSTRRALHVHERMWR
jgi:carboxypeptidase C (cathepsin A)